MAVQDELQGFAGDELEYALRHVFGLTLTPENGKSLKTVGDLHVLLSSLYESRFEEGCLSAPVFYKLRRGLEHLGVQRKAVKRNSPFEMLMPLEERRFHWATLQGEIGVCLPHLRYNRILENDISLLGVIGVMSFIASMFLVTSPVGVWPTYILSILMFSGCSHLNSSRCNSSLATTLPDEFVTVEDAVKQIIAWNYMHVVNYTQRWNSEELFESLQTILAQITSLEKEQITKGLKFADFL